MLSLIISFFMLSPWLIWNCFLLYFILKFDKSFNYIILTKRQLINYWTYIFSVFIFSSYIFFVRLNNITRTINIYEITQKNLDFLNSLSVVYLVICTAGLLLLLTFWFLVLKLIYVYLRRCLLTLFLYYRQYDSFCVYCSRYIRLSGDFTFYLLNRVVIFTTNKNVLFISRMIWPGFLTFFEPKIFTVILPYLFIFDFITQNGNISTVFIVLPWFYIYALIRLSGAFFKAIFIPENTEFSNSVYKSITFNGKTVRWVEIPEMPKT